MELNSLITLSVVFATGILLFLIACLYISVTKMKTSKIQSRMPKREVSYDEALKLLGLE